MKRVLLASCFQGLSPLPAVITYAAFLKILKVGDGELG